MRGALAVLAAIILSPLRLLMDIIPYYGRRK